MTRTTSAEVVAEETLGSDRRHHGWLESLSMVSLVRVKSGREDLNLRPHGPEPCALAGLRYAPMIRS
jgi:hypothetical protein